LSSRPGLSILGQAKVDKERFSPTIEEHVGRLHVSVEHPVLMGVLKSAGEALSQSSREVHVQGPGLNSLLQGAPVDPVQDEEETTGLFVDTPHLHDVAVLEPRRELTFSQQPRAVLWPCA
jgi:hypothetical protein